MPRNLPQFTRCAAPGIAGPVSLPGILLTFFSVGILGYFLALGLLNCGAPIVAAALALISALDGVGFWYYNRRLMCIRSDQCAAGTVAGDPVAACDGDRKLDLLLAPFSVAEVDSGGMQSAINALVASGTIPPPAPGADLTVRANRLGYVEGLSSDNRKLLYMELVHNQTLNQPGRGYLGHFLRREAASMPGDAFSNCPDDSPGSTLSNPLFRFDGDVTGGENAFAKFFCESLLGFPAEDPKEHRLIPYLHCEVEGNRVQRGLTNLKLSIFAFAAAYAAACAVCEALTLGAGGVLCTIISSVVGAFFALLAWLLSKLFNDPDDGEVSQFPLDIPDPTTTGDGAAAGSQRNAVLVFGDWVKDTEHEQYFEIHPVKAWFLICTDPDGGGVPVEDPTTTGCQFDLRGLTEAGLQTMCALVTRSETTDPIGSHGDSTSGALSVAGGLK